MKDRIKLAQEFADAIKTEDIEKIILFGSVARHEYTPDSDIDILIISNHGEKIEPLIANEVVRIILDEEELISAHVISEKHFNKTKSYSFISNVLRDGVVLV